MTHQIFPVHITLDMDFIKHLNSSSCYCLLTEGGLYYCYEGIYGTVSPGDIFRPRTYFDNPEVQFVCLISSSEL